VRGTPPFIFVFLPVVADCLFLPQRKELWRRSAIYCEWTVAGHGEVLPSMTNEAWILFPLSFPASMIFPPSFLLRALLQLAGREK